MKRKNKKSKKVNSVSVKSIVIYIVALLIIIFLSLPLIFKDKTKNIKTAKKHQETLPLKTENPFTHYFNLFKNFYGLDNKKGQNEFAQRKKQSLMNKEQNLTPEYFVDSSQENPSTDKKNYYDETAQNVQDINIPQNYNPSQENNNNVVIQEPFEDFLMEGLYEASQLDPYEVKQAARKNIFDIFSANTFASLSSGKQLKQAVLTNDSLLAKSNPSQKTKTILFNDETNTNQVSASANKYLNKVFNPFRTNETVTDKINIDGLPFETQANLVSTKLNTIYVNSHTSSTNHTNPNGENNQNGQNEPTPKPPLPPLPPKDTFDPTKWDPQVDVACSAPDQVAVQENIEQPKSAQQETQEENSDKIEHCDQELQDKLPKVNNNMQKNYNYLLVSGRYQGQIMIPAYNSLSDTILTFGIQSDDFNFLNYPEQLQGKKFSQNTKPTDFQFVVDLNPQVFNQMMQDEKTILISVDPEDQTRFPQKTILIQSGEIETFSGVNRIVDEINHFKQKQEELKKLAKEQENKEKEQMAENLKDKINAAI